MLPSFFVDCDTLVQKGIEARAKIRIVEFGISGIARKKLVGQRVTLENRSAALSWCCHVFMRLAAISFPPFGCFRADSVALIAIHAADANGSTIGQAFRQSHRNRRCPSARTRRRSAEIFRSRRPRRSRQGISKEGSG